MPIFEYNCLSCGEPFELLVLRSEASPTCPECSSSKVERAISLVSVSSGQSRGSALRKAKKRAAEVRHDKEYHEHRAEHKHNH